MTARERLEDMFNMEDGKSHVGRSLCYIIRCDLCLVQTSEFLAPQSGGGRVRLEILTRIEIHLPSVVSLPSLFVAEKSLYSLPLVLDFRIV